MTVPHNGIPSPSIPPTDAEVADLIVDGEIRFVSSTGVLVSSGSGSPEGVLSAPVGSIFLRSDGGTGTTFYKKGSGTGNTGWVVQADPAAHALVGAEHTASGLTAGHVLRATGATTFAFGALADSDVPATIARDTEVATAVSDHAALADPHPGYLLDPVDGNETVNALGPVAGAVALDPSTGNVVSLTMTGNTTVTIAQPAGAGGSSLILWVTQDVVGGHALTVAATGGTVTDDGTITADTTADTVTRYLLERVPGTTNDWMRNIVGGSGGGNVATDAIWDAAGDLVVGTGLDTAARLAKGAAGANLSTYNGAVAWNGGTSFPASPATGDRYWRSDLGAEAYWDGTRWLSVQRYDIVLPPTTALQPLTAPANVASNRTALPSGTARYIEKIYAAFYVTGGTALSASHKWVVTYSSQPGATAIGTLSIDSGASDAYRYISTTVNAVNPASDYWIDAAIQSTGSPGTLILMPRVIYRLIYT